MKKIFILCILWANIVLDQNKPEVPKIAIPSANASAITKYGDFPVGHFTGTPTINIPIYNITDGDLSIPISINYNASGIKVSEEASQIGLGWSLSCGGLISKNTIGNDDLFGTNYFSNTTQLPIGEINTNSNVYWGNNAGQSEVFSYDFGQNSPVIFNTNWPYDYEPDQFSLNAGSLSTKFVIDKQKKIIQNAQQNVKIEFIEGTNSVDPKFIALAPDGTQYEFTDTEKYLDYNGDLNLHISSWYLSKITSSDGKVAVFKYKKPYNNYDSIPMGSISDTHFTNLGTPECATPGELTRTYGNINTTQNLVLDEVIWSNGRIQFNYENRDDVKNDKRLVSIGIYKKLEDDYEALFKTYSLNQSYFDAALGQIDDENIFTNRSDNYKRLKLDSIAETAGNINLPPHVFEYYEGGNYNNLPAKTSFARDHWGYFNGKFGNTSLIPTFTPFPASNTYLGIIGYISGGEKDADPQFIRANSLKKITYPTGGYTVFDMESNQFEAKASLDNDYNQTGLTLFTEEVNVIETYTSSNTGNTQERSFEFDAVNGNTYNGGTNSNVGVMKINAFVYFQNNPDCYNSYLSQVDKIYLDIVDNTNNQTVYRLNMLGNSVEKICASNNTISGIRFNGSINLTAGESYTLKMYAAPNPDLPVSVFTSTLSWQRYKKADGEVVNGGGLRLKSMSHWDGSTLNVKKYTYTKTLTTANTSIEISSGTLTNLPLYSFYTSSNCLQTFSCGNCPSILNRYPQLQRTSNTINPLVSGSSGNVIGYSKVTEWLGENGENGKNEYEYGNAPDQSLYRGLERPPFNAFFAYPYYGKILKEIMYKKQGTSFVPIHEKRYEYDYRLKEILWGADLRKEWLHGNLEPINERRRAFFYRAMQTVRSANTKVYEKTYDAIDPSKFTESVTENTYPNANYLQLGSSITTHQDGDTEEIIYQYPYDLASPINTAMIAKNQVAEVVQYTTKDGNDKEETMQVVHSQASNGSILPQKFTSYKGNSIEGVVEATLSYDADGNVSQQIDKAGLGTSLTYYNTVGLKNMPKTISTGSHQESKLEYSPLVGPTKIEELNGKYSTFEYDALGRLILDKNDNGQVANRYCYNYQGQLVACNSLALNANISPNFVDLISESSGPLAVKIISFEAQKQGDDAVLKWTLNADANTNELQLQHSTNGKEWQSLYQKNLQASQNYTDEFMHAKPSLGTHYYRLQNVDNQGKTSFSATKSLVFDGQGYVYPNPVGNADKLHLDKAQFAQISQMTILNLQGKKIMEIPKTTDQVSLKVLPFGQYILEIRYYNGSTKQHKIVKL